MGKRPKATQRASSAAGVGPSTSRGRAAGDGPYGNTTAFAWHSAFEGSAHEAGLCVIRRRSSVGYLAIFGLVVMLAAGTLLACTASLPRLLTHWAWFMFTIFSCTVFVGRWLYPDVEALILVFFTLTIHGLLWLTLLLVPLCGVTPGALWYAFGIHGGDHLLLAQLGDLPLLLFPPLSLLCFLVWERRYLVAVFHDFLYQLAPGHFKWLVGWQLTSPIIPLGLWSACFRLPLFTDLPAWPGVPAVLAVCLLANGPLLFYAYWRTLPYQGAAHWFDGGVVLWSAG